MGLIVECGYHVFYFKKMNATDILGWRTTSGWWRRDSLQLVQQHELPEEERGHKQGAGLQQLHLPHPRADEKTQVIYFFTDIISILCKSSLQLYDYHFI